MQGTSLTKQERECKLYNEFDKFTYKKAESLHEYYLRFTLLLNDMNIYKMPLEQFQHGDDPIDVINHVMSFLSAVVTSCYPTTNNQLRNSSNPRQQATINDGRITVQPVQGRQISYAAGTTRTFTPRASGSNWNKPEGTPYPHDLSKLIPLILNVRGRLFIPFDHFINNDLEYLKGGSLSHKYTTSITKTKATDYGQIK
ncbi:hypothetical protein Tco_1245044 [Tanacetum coccineum]